MATTPRSRHLGALALLAIVISGCGSTPAEAPEPTTEPVHAVQGVLTLGSDAIGWWLEGEPCGGGGGYDDLVGGAPLVVRDADGTTVAQGQLNPGQLRVLLPSPEAIGRPVGRKAECDLGFRVDVPGGSDFYELTFGNHPAIPLTADDLDSPLSLTID